MLDLNILKQKSKSESLEYLYKEIDDLIENLKFREIDNKIKEFVDDGDFKFPIFVGFLTVTNRAKHKFKNRKLLWKKAIDKGKEYLSDKQVQATLNGLE